ncbi:MAG: DUF1343 domain-containing protein [Armatimonadetes bacterium CG_4_10_14_3_um_filter_66_18]|nr:DUF1343 domain-containing protein [Armatimonadota bacterium]OIO99101.1 MAG: hypothetical protein AUJ96_20100 [Armatimonadetes bacterium CG2_30_66_41]PIU92822.1 MAG: DUF1343 domain-containing protein [Armatimonadetes bacterium CG06_land_8_20_14_3_00_66_21]PIX46360.1 MAG: DUF1343 domain-containing protein [Armatimonadetes bacterium CG_4_8_14_3_um_filter_66_20]PIY39445.1 MAG: DUF1343 domain-containing protein [Armatimonadetes bacterium CG_4_10_14_3_um_filter_66_18]PJB63397.1 MAG: DUF1343 domai
MTQPSEGGSPLKLGIDALLSTVGSRRVGLITGPSAWTADRGHPIDFLRREATLAALFAPEHGVWGQAQAGVHVASTIDARTGLPAHSLYDENQEPSAEMLEGLDVLVFCMQEVGCRYYTFMMTMARCMEAAAKHGLPFLVLDQPTPLRGDVVQGNVAKTIFFPLPLPIRLGMTHGELATWLAAESDWQLDLTVIPVEGWTRNLWFDETGLPWVAPSPNLPTLQSAVVFPCTCVLEATNVSEGRGTTRPFELLGAPWMDGFAVADALSERGLTGAAFRPAYFEPTFSKWEGEVCCGIQLHVLDRDVFDPVRTCFHLLEVLRTLHPNELEIRASSFDVRLGDAWVREALEAGESAEAVWQRCCDEAARFGVARRSFLLY